MTSTLIIGDDINVIHNLTKSLERDDFIMTVCGELKHCITELETCQFDLIVIDLNDVNVGNLYALISVRSVCDTPVILMTQPENEQERVLGLELGADDCISKSYSNNEITARIKALLRRTSKHSPMQHLAQIEAGPFLVYPESRVAEFQNSCLVLTSIEFNLIEILVKNAGQIVSKNELSESGLGRPLQRHDRSIDVHISRLRNKLGCRPDNQSWIQTVRGHGYQLSHICL